MPYNNAGWYEEERVERQRGQAADARAGESRNRYVRHLQGGEAALQRYIRGAVNAGMPALDASLQRARSNAIRRGVANGQLGTSYEGDLYSAFQGNIADAAAQQSLGLYQTQLGGYGDVYQTDTALGEGSRNRYLDIMAGNRDYEIAEENRRRQKKSGLFGGIGAAVGGIGGAILGGPAGAAIGARAGYGLGSGLGG